MKKWIGILIIAFIGVALILLIADRILFIHYKNNYQFKDQVGYLAPFNSDYHSTFKRCNSSLPIGSYSSARNIFAGDKASFVHQIKSEFNTNDFGDNGILNLRFIISCKGDVGDVETNELDFDFNKKNLSKGLVDRLKKLSFKKENWNYEQKENTDYYMYLIYRIENGKVVEVLP